MEQDRASIFQSYNFHITVKDFFFTATVATISKAQDLRVITNLKNKEKNPPPKPTTHQHTRKTKLFFYCH